MPNDKLQNDDLVKAHLRNHDRLAGLRAPWEATWQDIDDRVDPLGNGGFNGYSGATGAFRNMPSPRGRANFDVTAVESLDRFGAAMAAITVPFQTQYIRVKFRDNGLDKLPAVRRWCEYAGDRLYAMRYAAHTGFGVQAGEDFRQLGKYGTGPLWTGERKGVGLFYKSIHLSECFIDEDFAGAIDTVHRKFERTVRQLEQEFGLDALTPRMRDAFRDNKLDATFQLLHVVCPAGDFDPDALDRRSMMVDSIHIAIDEKIILRRSGYHSMPISVSRHITGPGDIYGRSPALKVLPTIKGLDQMAQTILRNAHKAVDPALAFFDDDGITSLTTKPGGANPGLVDERGNILVAAMPGGGANLPIGFEMQEQERRVVRTAFLEDFFKLLTEDAVQRSATAVLEIASKQGVLVAPYASRYETEKQNPVTHRDLDLAMRARQIDPLPAEVMEAGAYPQIHYWNPLSRMARAEEASGFTRWVEAVTPIAQVDGGAVFDHVDTDAAATGLADVLGVRPTWIATPDQVAAKRKARSDAEAATSGVAGLGDAAGAYLDIAKANQISEAA